MHDLISVTVNYIFYTVNKDSFGILKATIFFLSSNEAIQGNLKLEQKLNFF